MWVSLQPVALTWDVGNSSQPRACSARCAASPALSAPGGAPGPLTNKGRGQQGSCTGHLVSASNVGTSTSAPPAGLVQLPVGILPAGSLHFGHHLLAYRGQLTFSVLDTLILLLISNTTGYFLREVGPVNLDIDTTRKLLDSSMKFHKDTKFICRDLFASLCTNNELSAKRN